VPQQVPVFWNCGGLGGVVAGDLDGDGKCEIIAGFLIVRSTNHSKTCICMETDGSLYSNKWPIIVNSIDHGGAVRVGGLLSADFGGFK